MGVTSAAGARFGSSRGQRPCLTGPCSQGTCARGRYPAAVYCRSAVRRNTANTSALWTCPEGSVFPAVFLRQLAVACTLPPTLRCGGRLTAPGTQWKELTAGNKRDALDPGGERVANTDDGHVAMRLLAAAWRQKRPAAAWLRRKGAVTKQPQVMFPFQHKRSRRACLP